MSGLELLFIDGGTTVGIVAGAAAEWLGFKQKQRDDKTLASDQGEIQELQRTLQEVHDDFNKQHAALINVWRSPLSLFSEADVEAAEAKGVPLWAAPCALKAQRLIQEGVELCDFAEVYLTQINIAKNGRTGLVKKPVQTLIARLEELAHRIQLHVPYLKVARRAFDEPSSSSEDKPLTGLPSRSVSSMFVSSSPSSSLSRQQSDLPIAILKDRGLLGKFWQLQSAAAQRLLEAQLPNLGLHNNTSCDEDDAVADHAKVLKDEPVHKKIELRSKDTTQRLDKRQLDEQLDLMMAEFQSQSAKRMSKGCSTDEHPMAGNMTVSSAAGTNANANAACHVVVPQLNSMHVLRKQCTIKVAGVREVARCSSKHS